MPREQSRPLAAGGGQVSGGGYRARAHYSTPAAPVALQVHKRGRWCTVAKVTVLDGARVLAVAVRHQQGTETTVSVPLLAVDYAEQAGCRWFYWRHDRHLKMRRIRLAALRAEGWLQEDGELYIHLDRMEQVPWAKWPFAQEEIRLAPQPEADAGEPTPQGKPQAVQLGLFAAAKR